MEFTILAAAAVSALSPFLAKAGDAAAQKAGEGIGQSLYDLLIARGKDPEQPKKYNEVLDLLEKKPDSIVFQEAFKEKLIKDLKNDPSFLEELQSVVQPILYDNSSWEISSEHKIEDSYNNNTINSGNTTNSHNHYSSAGDQHFGNETTIGEFVFNRNEAFRSICKRCGSIHTMKLSVAREKVLQEIQEREGIARRKFEAKLRELELKRKMSRITIAPIPIEQSHYPVVNPVYYPPPRMIGENSYPSLKPIREDYPLIPPKPVIREDYPYVPPNSAINNSIYNRSRLGIDAENPLIDLSSNIPIRPVSPPQPINISQSNYPVIQPYPLANVDRNTRLPEIYEVPRHLDISLPPPKPSIVLQPSITLDFPEAAVEPQIEELSPEERQRRKIEVAVLACPPPEMKSLEDFGFRTRNFRIINLKVYSSIGFATFVGVSVISGNFLVSTFFLALGAIAAKGWFEVCQVWQRNYNQKKTECIASTDHYNQVIYPKMKLEWEHKYICKECCEIFVIND